LEADFYTRFVHVQHATSLIGAGASSCARQHAQLLKREEMSWIVEMILISSMKDKKLFNPIFICEVTF
jgi:hypothetical protein